MIVPFASKSFCARHISKNLKMRFRDNIAMGYYWRSLNTYSNVEYNVQMNLLQQHNPLFLPTSN
jgi:hypothetical protein